MITPSFSLTATERVLPRLALDFTTASLDSRITFTRTTGASNPATYVASNGYVTAATNDQPRFDFDPVTLLCKGLLIEESRQNLVKDSSDYSTANWIRNRSTTATSAVVSPDGVNTARFIAEDTTFGAHGVSTTPALTVTIGQTYTMSVFAKAGTNSWIIVNFIDTTAVQTYFNVSTGTIGTIGSGCTATIENYGNGWYRCSVAKTMTTTSLTYQVLTTRSNNLYTYAGATDRGNYFWGSQLELGSFATSYIPTTTTALTRNADVATMTGTNFSSWFNASEGTFAAEFQLQSTSQVSISMLSANAGSINNRYEIGLRSTGTNVSVVTTSSATVAILDFGAPTTAITNQTLAYKENSFAGAKNGGTVGTDTAGALPTVNSLNIGSRANDAFCNGWLRAVNYWPLRVTNSEAQAFSKG